jgi:hypothetical protein
MLVAFRSLQPWVQPFAQWCLDAASAYGIRVTVTSTGRDSAKQAELYAAWRAGRSRFPANRPGDSSHEFGMAWDSVVAPGDQRDWNAIRRYAGFEVLDNDIIHAQVPSWRQFKPTSQA